MSNGQSIPAINSVSVANETNYSKRRALKAANELAKRETEALRLYVPQQLQEEFHKCDAPECMIMGGNRAGKSLAAFIEDGRAVTGTDPYDKYPKENGILAIVGYKEWHIGNVIYPYLFEPGAFKIIRDLETGLWRVYRPWVPQDAARKKDARPAPPIIPKRYIKKIVWKNRGERIFSNVHFHNGWEIKAFSSAAVPEQGYQADLFHIDEDVINARWYNEAKGRLIDRSGRLIWSALPHDDNDAISRFAERAEQQKEVWDSGGPKPTTVMIRASMEDNPYLPEDAKRAAIEGWKSMGEDVYRKRALGELVTDSVLMYPMWKRGLHGVEHYIERLPEVAKFMEVKQVPDNWTRRLAVDPGHDTGAALLIATPPSAKFHLVFGEIYIHGCTAIKIAQALYEVTRSMWFQTFLIDAHGGNLTSMDTGVSPREAYEREMALRDVRCVETAHRFIPGCSVIAYREEVLRNMLSCRGEGIPQILVDFEACPNLDREMRRFRKKKVGDQIIDTGNRRVATHLVECLEYLSAYVNDTPSPYVKPKGRRKAETPGQRRVREYRRRKADRIAQQNPFGVTSTIILGPQGVMQ